MSTGYRIHQRRKSHGWSLRALAAKANVSAQAISKYERDLDVPGSAVLLRLAEAFEVQVEYFFRPRQEWTFVPARGYWRHSDLTVLFPAASKEAT